GDNVICGGYDCKLAWFDLDLSTKPYKLLRDLLQNPLIVPVKVLRGHALTHDLGVLDVTFHPSQPWLFSSGADATIRLFT
ncbi:hypothetical protein CRUP_008108, partial [Coryphaenoides rupestris]